jgi:hypothetical protein
MLLSRDELVSALFCETDRAQRLKMPLSLIAVGFAEGDGRESESEQVGYDGAERTLVDRITGILRCYDSVGKWADGEFLLLLPGCTAPHARTLAERLRDEAFTTHVEAGGGKLCVRAQGALQQAQAAGPGSIRLATDAETDPSAFLIPVVQRDGLHR